MSNVIWITGLSGSGKTTIARELKALLSCQENQAVLLDGDSLRAVLDASDTAFDRHGRKKLAFTYARFCKLLAEQGLIVICATISLFHDVHQWNRQNLPGYFEVFIDTPYEERKKRDPKGLYEQYKNGSIGEMAGIDLEVEFPQAPDLTIYTTLGQGARENAQQICEDFCKKFGLVPK